MLRLKNSTRRYGLAVFTAFLVLLTVPKVFAEGGRKGPDAESVADLEEAIKPDAPKAGSAASDPDAQSLADLEKVIESEDAKTPGKIVRDLPPPRQSAPARRTAKAAPTKGEDLDVLNEPEAIALDEDTKRAAAAVSDNDPIPALEDAPPATAAPAERRRSTAEAPAPKAPRKTVAAVVPSNQRNTITNLEFKMEGAGSRLAVTARSALRYREIKNPGMRQVIYYFDNTLTPERLQRAYDTTEFASAVALFTLLQIPGEKPPTSKLIVQLREDREPTVLATERGLYIDFGPPSPGTVAPRSTASNGGGGGGRNGGKIALDGDIYQENQSFAGRRIKLEIKNSEVPDVLRLIAKTSGYNIVVGDDVTGKVGTLSLENVPWDQAFALVLQSKKLGYIRSGNVLRVATLESLKKEKEDAFANEKAKIQIESLRTVIIPISYAKASDLQPQAKPFLTTRGSVDVDTRTNQIIIKDIDKVVTRLQKLFSALDTAPPRVAISAKFVEMTTRMTNDIGASLSLTQNLTGLNVAGTAAYSTSARTAVTLSAPQFAALEAKFNLEEFENRVRTLANPSVTVVANQKATVTRSFSFFVPATDQGSVGGLAGTPTLKQITTTLSLDVTPIVAGDGSIFMNLTINNEIPNPNAGQTTIDGRNVKTQVLIDNGDTAVVSGIFSNTVRHSMSGVPILSRIPIIGTLFSTVSDGDERSEIFIFITAKITNAEDSFKRNL